MTDQLVSTVHDVALVFEGGGMRASYTAPVVQVLCEQGWFFDWVSGISAGSSNTVNYLSRDVSRARASFTDFAADPRMGGWGTFLRGKGLFAAEYIYEHTGGPAEALPFDFAAFTANPARMRLGAFRCRDGAQVWFTKDDTPTLGDLMKRVRASSTMPIAMPPTLIDDELYVDGALGPTAGIPLAPAIDEGFERYVVVLTRPRDYTMGSYRLAPFFRAWWRRHPAVAEAMIHRWRTYNPLREQIFDLERDGKALVFAPTHMAVHNHTRDVAALRASYAAGLAQVRRELPRWRDFLGL
ncbi:MAG: patatin family protein [Actinomycetia bacterium]|nr:patatin family protein [Actinomycetes bacterium]